MYAKQNRDRKLKKNTPMVIGFYGIVQKVYSEGIFLKMLI